jgi:hypothetical protein
MRIDASQPPQEPNFTVPEIQAGKHKKGGVDAPSMIDVLKMNEVELAAFMEEPVTIEMNPPASNNDMLGTSIVCVPDTQWVLFGVEQTIKRKYVEILANARSENYRQHHDPHNPANSRPKGTTVFSYPFTVKRDSAKGYAWFKELISRRA